MQVRVMARLAGLGGILLLSCSGKVVPIGWSPAVAGAPSVDSDGMGGARTGGYGAVAGGSGTEQSLGCAQQLASGDSHVCVLYAGGSVWCAGANHSGQLGLGTAADSPLLSQVALPPVTRIAAGGDHTCAVTNSGQVYCWGDNQGSELGVPGLRQSLVPVLVREAESARIVQLVAGRQHTCALDILVHGFCWGTNTKSSTVLSVPTQLPQIGLAPLQVLAAGGSETRVIDSGVLFDAYWAEPNSLGRVSELDDGVIDNAISAVHDCVLKRSGTVWCRGGSYPNFYAVVAEFGSDVVELKVGEGFTCARSSDGKIACEGENGWGQLGGGSLENGQGDRGGVRVVDLAPAAEMSLGRAHSCARLRDGSVWCWGNLGNAPLPGPGARANPGAQPVPMQLGGPSPPGSCQDVADSATSRPWGPAPKARAIDEFNDAVVAWGQNQCRCAFSDGAQIMPCVRDESPVLNGCLAALAPHETCTGAGIWDAAVCAVSCIGSGSLGECGPAPFSCGTGSKVAEFCLRRWLDCHDASDARANARDTCNGVADCSNGFDEANCTPDQTTFQCANGRRIELALVKNGVPDCADGSDE